MRPLAGVRVLDLSRLLPGPFLTQVLADLGADVIGIEEPGMGDATRHVPPEVEGQGYVFTATHRGKRSVAIDLKKPGAAALVLRLAARADVLVESFRPGVMDRLGLGDDALARANPRLVRLSLVGYAPGPWRDDPGHDINYVGLAGILDGQGTPDMPMPGAVFAADVGGAMYGAVATLAALLERERTGQGRRIEVALHDAALGLNAIALQRAASGDEMPPRGLAELGGGMPGYRIYRAGDGRFVALGTLEPKFWDRFVAAVGDPTLAPLHGDGSPAAHARVEALFATRPAQAWLELRKAGVPVTPILTAAEAARADPRFGGWPGPGSPLTGAGSPGAAPALGEHTEAVLRDAGLSEREMAALQRPVSLARNLFGGSARPADRWRSVPARCATRSCSSPSSRCSWAASTSTRAHGPRRSSSSRAR
jgi:crotonobetainyl-CoA:carnitine CoA-transferase CaiB-like acyl-CoA transferase